MSFLRFKIDSSPIEPQEWDIILQQNGLQDFLQERALSKNSSDQGVLKTNFIAKLKSSLPSIEEKPPIEEAVQRWITVYSNRAREWACGSLKIGDYAAYSDSRSDTLEVEAAFERTLQTFVESMPDSKTNHPSLRYWMLSNCGHQAAIHAQTFECLPERLRSQRLQLFLDSELTTHHIQYHSVTGLTSHTASPGLLHSTDERDSVDSRIHFHNCQVRVQARALFKSDELPRSEIVTAKFITLQAVREKDTGVEQLSCIVKQQRQKATLAERKKTQLEEKKYSPTSRPLAESDATHLAATERLDTHHPSREEKTSLPLKQVTPLLSFDIDNTCINTESTPQEITPELLTIIYFCQSMNIPLVWSTNRTIEMSKMNILSGAADAGIDGCRGAYRRSLTFFDNALRQQGIFAPIINTPLDEATHTPYVRTIFLAEKDLLRSLRFNSDGSYNTNASKTALVQFDTQWEAEISREREAKQALSSDCHRASKTTAIPSAHAQDEDKRPNPSEKIIPANKNNKAKQINLGVDQQTKRYQLTTEDPIELLHVDDEKKICESLPMIPKNPNLSIATLHFEEKSADKSLMQLAEFTGLDLYAKRLWITGQFQKTKPCLADLAALRYLIQTHNNPSHLDRLKDIISAFYHQHYFKLRPAQQDSLDSLIYKELQTKPATILSGQDNRIEYYRTIYPTANKTTQRIMNQLTDREQEPQRSQCLYQAARHMSRWNQFKNQWRSLSPQRKCAAGILITLGVICLGTGLLAKFGVISLAGAASILTTTGASVAGGIGVIHTADIARTARFNTNINVLVTGDDLSPPPIVCTLSAISHFEQTKEKSSIASVTEQTRHLSSEKKESAYNPYEDEENYRDAPQYNGAPSHRSRHPLTTSPIAEMKESHIEKPIAKVSSATTLHQTNLFKKYEHLLKKQQTKKERLNRDHSHPPNPASHLPRLL